MNILSLFTSFVNYLNQILENISIEKVNVGKKLRENTSYIINLYFFIFF